MRFAYVGDDSAYKWQMVKDWEEARRLSPNGLYEVIIVTKREDELLVWKESGSPSGDSFVFTQECYRGDGSLAWWEESFRTFHTTAGLGEALTEASYTPDGKMVAKRRTFRARESGKPLKEGDFFYGNGKEEWITPELKLKGQTVFKLLPEKLSRP